MFIDCTECGAHVYAHATEKTIAYLGLNEAVYCEDCLRDKN